MMMKARSCIACSFSPHKPKATITTMTEGNAVSIATSDALPTAKPLNMAAFAPNENKPICTPIRAASVQLDEYIRAHMPFRTAPIVKVPHSNKLRSSFF
ncbi:hypothetical protein D3C78_1663960 [compost metagenome]